MYPHVTQFETRTRHWNEELQLRSIRRRPRLGFLARLPLMSRALAPGGRRPSSVGGA